MKLPDPIVRAFAILRRGDVTLDDTGQPMSWCIEQARDIILDRTDEVTHLTAELAALRERVAELAEEAFSTWYDAACSENYGARSRHIDAAQAAGARMLAALRGPAAVKGGTTDGE